MSEATGNPQVQPVWTLCPIWSRCRVYSFESISHRIARMRNASRSDEAEKLAEALADAMWAPWGRR